MPSTSRSRRSAKATRIVLGTLVVGASCALAIGTLELALALLAMFPPRHGVLHEAAVQYYQTFRWRLIQYFPDCARYDPVLNYTLRPGSCRFKNQEFDTRVHVNSAGFRGTEESLHSPAIIVLGDSFAMGWGVDDDSTVAVLLERETGLRTLNTAVASYATPHELLTLERVDLHATRTIVIQYCQNDYPENEDFIRQNGRAAITTRAGYDSIVTVHFRQTRYYPGKLIRWMVPTIRDAWLGKAPRWLVTASGTDQAERFLDVLLRSPVPLDPYRIVVFATCDPGAAAAFTDALRRRVVDQRLPKWIQQIRVVDVPRALADSDYYPLDRHLRASGHVKIARLLAPAVMP